MAEAPHVITVKIDEEAIKERMREVVADAKAEAVRDAANQLRAFAVQEFDLSDLLGADPRGAAIWDAALWLDNRANAYQKEGTHE